MSHYTECVYFSDFPTGLWVLKPGDLVILVLVSPGPKLVPDSQELLGKDLLKECWQEMKHTS